MCDNSRIEYLNSAVRRAASAAALLAHRTSQQQVGRAGDSRYCWFHRLRHKLQASQSSGATAGDCISESESEHHFDSTGRSARYLAPHWQNLGCSRHSASLSGSASMACSICFRRIWSSCASSSCAARLWNHLYALWCALRSSLGGGDLTLSHSSNPSWLHEAALWLIHSVESIDTRTWPAHHCR